MITHEERILKQFGLRAPTFERSAHWITDPKLAEAHVAAAEKPGKGIALCCGTGVVGRFLVHAGWEMLGVDITPEMVQETSKHFPAIVANAETIPVASQSFDLAIMRQAYFLLANGPKVLQEIRRVVKPGGRFVLSQTVPFSEVDTPWLRKVHQTKQKEMVRFFTAEDLEEELKKHGFQIEGKKCVSVRESVSLWMKNAPEMEPERRQAVCDLVVNSPPEYRKLRNVETVDGEIIEDWNWVILSARI
jgi:SAM-dependent methyltransferase